MFTTIFSRKPRFFVSKDQYYETVTSGNTYLKSIAKELGEIRQSDCETNHHILFNNTLNLDATYKEIIDSLGKPVHQTKKDNSDNYSILFYKKKVESHLVRLEIHVVNQQFLIGFITFNLTTEREKRPVIESISNDYEINRAKNHLEDFNIYNKDQEFLKVIDSVDLTLVYGKHTESNSKMIREIASND